MSAHTPGPWRVVEEYGDCLVQTRKGVDVATAWDWDDLPAAANARLIAAAPELLEVVRECRALLNDAESCHPESSAQDMAWNERRGDTVAKAAAALARVEGE